MTKPSPNDQLAMFLGGAKPPTAQDDAKWSDLQRDIFKEAREGHGNVAIEARAGTGKTTTIVEIIRRLPSSRRILYAAFNRAIADEVKPKLAQFRNVDVKTLHGVGYAVLRQHDEHAQVDENKGYHIAREVAGNDAHQKLVTAIKKAMAICKSNMIDSQDTAEDVIDEFEIECEPYANTQELARLTLQAMKCSAEMTGIVDFDDQVWLPPALGLRSRFGYDEVFIDEGQDVAEGQFRLCMSVVKPNGRIWLVGDDNQMIYAWRGASRQMWQSLIKRLNAKVMPLSITYRCGKAIVREANTIVPDFYAPKDAHEGKVTYITREQMRKMMKPGDFVLSRANAALIQECTAAIRAGVKSNIQGRDLGETLTNLIRKFGAEDVDELIEEVEKWRIKEIDKKQKKGHDTTPVTDRAECLLAFCDGAKTIGDVLRNIAMMFSDSCSQVVFSSVHRAKGLERDRVFLLRPTFLKARMIEGEWVVPREEQSLYYVAVTRAKHELFIVT